MGTVKRLAEEVERGLWNLHPKLLKTVVSKLSLAVGAMIEGQTPNTVELANLLPLETERQDMREQWTVVEEPVAPKRGRDGPVGAPGVESGQPQRANPVTEHGPNRSWGSDGGVDGVRADRKGDLRALIDVAARRGCPAGWLIQSQHDRNTADGDKLWDRLARSKALGEVEFALPAPGRPARVVRQTLYRDAVTLPARKGDAHPGPKTLWEDLQRVQMLALGVAAAKAAYASDG